MDAKQRAQFINAQKYQQQEPAEAEIPEEPVAREEKKPEVSKAAVFQQKPVQEAAEPEEPSALAKGLPEWNLEPPAVVVRRKRR